MYDLDYGLKETLSCEKIGVMTSNLILTLILFSLSHNTQCHLLRF